MDRAVTAWRALLRRHFALALLVLFAGLAMRGIVPAGYMVSGNASGPVIKVCGGASGASVALRVGRKGDDGASRHAAEGACPYSVLAFGSLSGPAVLPEIAVRMGTAVRVPAMPQPVLPGAREYSQPPARAPPLA